jgi:hypothetical protein
LEQVLPAHQAFASFFFSPSETNNPCVLAGAVIVIGADEAARGEVMVKSMRTGEQEAHKVQDVVAAVRKAL